MTRVALLVTHLMGTGHLVRIVAIAQALRAAGAQPTVISGGRPLPHIDTAGLDLVQLPPVTARVGDYRTLRDVAGCPIDDQYRAARRSALLRALKTIQPEILVCEMWPFGRRVLADEFVAALDSLPGVPVVGSVRDVLEPPSKPDRVREALGHAARMAKILVHGDRHVIPLEMSWPDAGSLGPKLAYTGYVAAPPPAPLSCLDTVLVSVGGGAIGRRLLTLAVEAASHSTLRWHLLVGGSDATAVADTLPPPAVAEPVRADYRAMLQGAAASISLAGYNTAVEVALSATPALLVPMAEGGEREQTIRARAFAGAFAGIEAASIDALTPAGLAAIAGRLATSTRHGRALKADGAERTAQAILELCQPG